MKLQMKMQETANNGNVFAGTFGGMMLSVFSNVFVQDIVRTTILAIIGATASFLVSLILKQIFRRKDD